MIRRVLLLILILSSVTSSLSADGRILGRITRYTTGEPVAGVQVQIWSAGIDVASVVSGVDGTYQTDLLPDSTYYMYTKLTDRFESAVYVSNDRYHCFEHDCQVGPLTSAAPIQVSGTDVTGVDVKVGLFGSVYGTVRDAVNGKPLTQQCPEYPAMYVSFAYQHKTFGELLVPSDTFSLKIPEDFSFRLMARPQVPTNGMNIYYGQWWPDQHFDHPMYPPAPTVPLQTIAGDERRNIDIFVKRIGSTIEGIAKWANPAMSGDVLVATYPNSGLTCSSGFGRYSLRKVPTGALTVYASGRDPGAVYQYWNHHDCPPGIPCQKDVISIGAEGEIVENIDFDLHRTGRLLGRLTDAVSGAPLYDQSPSGRFQVTMVDSAGNVIETTTTAQDGSYTFPDPSNYTVLAPGTYYVRATQPRYETTWFGPVRCGAVSCGDTAGTPVRVEYEVDARADISMRSYPTFSGAVYDADTHEGIASAAILVDGTYAGSTDTDGKYFIQLSRDGAFEVSAKHDRYISSAYCASFCAGGSGTPVRFEYSKSLTGIEIVMKRAPRFSAVVVDGDTGFPLGYRIIEFFRTDGSKSASAGTDASGRLDVVSPFSGETFITINPMNADPYGSQLYDQRQRIKYKHSDVEYPISHGTPIVIPADRDIGPIQIRLRKSGTVDGSVVGDAGASVVGTISVSDSEGVILQKTAARMYGTFQFTATPGEYRLLTTNTLGYAWTSYGDVTSPAPDSKLGAILVVPPASQLSVTIKPPKIIRSIDPPQGSTLGNTLVTLRIADASPATEVLFGTEKATVVSATTDELQVLTPAQSAKSVDVSVRTEKAYAVLARAYKYLEPLCEPPSIYSISPQRVVIAAGSSARFEIEAHGSAPLSFEWFEGEAGDTSRRVGTSEGFFITPALRSSAKYWGRISNACGSATSFTFVVTVIESCAEPMIQVIAIESAYYGSTATLRVNVDGTGPFTYHWYEGQPGDTSKPQEGTSDMFTTPPLYGQKTYWVRVTSACGASADSAAMTISMKSRRGARK